MLTDQEDLKLLLEENHTASYGWALHCCGNWPEDAEDVLHTVYLKILDGRARYDGRAAFRTWLFAVIRHTAADERRRHWLRTLGLGRFFRQHGKESYQIDPAKKIDNNILLQAFLDALKQLPGRQREVLHLVLYQQMTLQEASDIVKVSVGSVRQHYERGKQRMRELLKNTEAFNEYR